MLDLQVEHWPALRPLVLVIKSLLKANGLNDVSTGGLGSFALANMALAHLQEEAKVRLGVDHVGVNRDHAQVQRAGIACIGSVRKGPVPCGTYSCSARLCLYR